MPLPPSFHFLRRVDADTFVECYGIDYEDFAAGQIFEHRPGFTFEAADCRRHALHAMDQSPQHADREYARAVLGGRQPVPESYLMSSMALSTKTLGKVVANLQMTNLCIAQVHVGDTLYYETEILDKRPSKSRPGQGLLHVATRARNQHGTQVVELERKLLVYRRGQGPYAATGY